MIYPAVGQEDYPLYIALVDRTTKSRYELILIIAHPPTLAY